MDATVYVCVNNRGGIDRSCGARGAPALMEALRAEAARRGFDLAVRPVACLGECARGPNLRLAAGRFWHECQAAEAPLLLDAILAEIKVPPPEGGGTGIPTSGS